MKKYSLSFVFLLSIQTLLGSYQEKPVFDFSTLFTSEQNASSYNNFEGY